MLSDILNSFFNCVDYILISFHIKLIKIFNHIFLLISCLTLDFVMSHVIKLSMSIISGVTSIDITGVETLVEIFRSLEVKEIKVIDIYTSFS